MYFLLLYTVGPFYITCGKEDKICLTVDKESGELQASPFVNKQTEFGEIMFSPSIKKFYIVRCDERSNTFNITCDAPVTVRRFKHLPKIPLYLTTSVNWLGHTSKNQPPTMVMSGKAESAQMALHSRKRTNFQSVKFTEWVNEKEVFFINCQESTKGRVKRGSYLCVKKKNDSFVVECEPEIKKHNDKEVFMLFRLLKVNPKSEIPHFCAHCLSYFLHYRE